MTEPRNCPDWCTAHTDVGVGLHRSAHAPIAYAKGGGYLYSCAVGLEGDDAPGGMSVTAVADRGPGAHVWLHDPAVARDIALLVGELAQATPKQHRDLAAQIRAAAQVLDPEEDK